MNCSKMWQNSTTLTNQNDIHDEIKSRLNSGNTCYYSAQNLLVGRPEGKRPLGRPKRRWEDNIKMDLREIGIDGANWIRLTQDEVQWRACVNTVMNLRVP
jgi:hypothetical protein